MQQDIAGCKREQPDMRLQVERCFHICEQYWALICKEMEGYAFPSAREEIRFYKHIKPIFVSEARYYRLLYHLLLFGPSGETGQLKDFQLRELQRFDKFVRDNKEFYEYYKSGCTERDEEWFRKTAEEEGEAPQYDILAGELLAMEKYADHLKKQIPL